MVWTAQRLIERLSKLTLLAYFSVAPCLGSGQRVLIGCCTLISAG
jgi:hypothetical protein